MSLGRWCRMAVGIVTLSVIAAISTWANAVDAALPTTVLNTATMLYDSNGTAISTAASGSLGVSGVRFATPGDAATTPLTDWLGSSGAVLYYFNGASFDRARSSSVGTGIGVAAPPDYSYAQIAAGQATTVVKNAAGFLHTVCFNSAATATNVTTFYDNASGSGTVIAIPAATTATVPTCLTYDLRFANGLTIITSTANSSNMTFSYR